MPFRRTYGSEYVRLLTTYYDRKHTILYTCHSGGPMETNMFAYLRLITIENILYYTHAIQEDLWKRICSPTYDLLPWKTYYTIHMPFRRTYGNEYVRLLTTYYDRKHTILHTCHSGGPMETNMFAYLRLITIENILYYTHAIQEDLWKRICSPTYDLLR